MIWWFRGHITSGLIGAKRRRSSDRTAKTRWTPSKRSSFRRPNTPNLEPLAFWKVCWKFSSSFMHYTDKQGIYRSVAKSSQVCKKNLTCNAIRSESTISVTVRLQNTDLRLKGLWPATWEINFDLAKQSYWFCGTSKRRRHGNSRANCMTGLEISSCRATRYYAPL